MSLKQLKGRISKKNKKNNSLSVNPINFPPTLKQRYQTLIFKTKLNFIKPFVFLIKHYEIREDFLKIYSAHVKEMYRNPRLMKPASLSRQKWGKRISDIRNESMHIDPHAAVNKMLEYALKKYRWFKELLNNFLEYLLLIFFILFLISIIVLHIRIDFLTPFDEYQKYITYLVLLPISFLITLILLYKYLLASDTELFHLINSKLAYNRKDVYLYQRYPRYNNRDIIAMVIWNHSLMNYSMYTVIFSMLCIKIISKNLIYYYLFKALREISPKYLEEYSKTPRDTIKIRKAMYKEWRSEFKKWWKEERTSIE